MNSKFVQLISTGLVLTLIILSSIGSVKAQGISFGISYDILPYQDFKDEIVVSVGNSGLDTTYLNDPRVRLNKTSAYLTIPLVFRNGQTVIVNDLKYQYIEFDYKNFDYVLKRLHSASYTLMLQQQLSQKWSVWAISTTSLASDLEADISEDDFNMQVALVAIRQFSERFSLGFGAAYSTQFGSATPLPVLAIDWNNGKNIMIKAIMPVSFELWYRASDKIDLGLVVAGDGNNYHGDPEIYGVSSPELRYTMLTLGPAAKIVLSKKATLNMEAGLIGLHRFEFYDSDTEVVSYDLQPKQYIRFGFSFNL